MVRGPSYLSFCAAVVLASITLIQAAQSQQPATAVTRNFPNSSDSRGRALLEDQEWLSQTWPGSSAFSWSTEDGVKEEILPLKRDHYTWRWPAKELSGSWRSPAVSPLAPVRLADVPSCAGLLPAPAYSRWPVTGSDATEAELQRLAAAAKALKHREERAQQEEEGEGSLNHRMGGDLKRSEGRGGKKGGDSVDRQGGEGAEEDGALPQERWFVWAPRFGLGNSLRGFTSSFVFALLSGRRLLRWHGGPHGKVLDQLCAAFNCSGIDRLHTGGEIRRYLHLQSTHHPFDRSLLFHPSPLLGSNAAAFFDQSWRSHRDMRQCVFHALHCSSIWCVRSHAMAALLGKPQPFMASEIERFIKWAPAADSPPPDLSPVAVRSYQTAMLETEHDPFEAQYRPVQPETGARLQFDVGLHIRTGDGSMQLSECGPSDKKCREGASSAVLRAVGRAVQRSKWLCPLRLLLFLRTRKFCRPPEREGAGAAPALIPIEGEEEAKGKGGQEEGEKEEAEEEAGEVSEDTMQGSEEPEEAAASPAGLAGRLMAFLGVRKGEGAGRGEGRRLQQGERMRRLPEGGGRRKGRGSRRSGFKRRSVAGGRRGQIRKRMTSASATRHHGRSTTRRALQEEEEGRVVWMRVLLAEEKGRGLEEEAAEALTREEQQQVGGGWTALESFRLATRRGDCLAPAHKLAKRGGGKEEAARKGIAKRRLRIFLATDNPLLRAQAVQFLRPFGDVFFSTGLVRHIAHVGNSSAPRTLIDFYLLGRSAVVYSSNKYISTFALFAALRANVSLFAGHAQVRDCTAHVENLMKFA